MNTQNNGGATDGVQLFILFATIGFVVTAFLSAIAFFISIVMTFVAFMAWRKPLELGRATVYPHEARAFVKRGVVGAFMLALFGVFLKEKMGVHLTQEALNFLFMGGYAVGSVGVEMAYADLPRRAPPQAEPTPNSPASGALVVIERGISRKRRPFQYASWDDEEAGR